MINENDNYITLREAVKKKLLSVRDCAYTAYLLSIIVNKMMYDSNGGGHFNIDPDNVLILKEDGNEVKVTLIGEDSPHASCNGKPDFNTNILNPCCRAPETFFGKFTPASDVYSLGMILAFMLKGGLYPYHFDESADPYIIRKLVKNPKNIVLENVPEELKDIIYKAINKKSGDRHNDAEEFGLSLVDYLGLDIPNSFCCFSDDIKTKINDSFNTDEEEQYDRHELDHRHQKIHVDVDMSVKVGAGFKDVAGMDDIKKILHRDFVEIVNHRELAKEFGIMPSNILLYGAPGTGKTFISKKLAEECGLDVCYVKPSDLGSIWLHGSQGMIKNLFQKAEDKAKQNNKGCILLIDEMDALCGDRNVTGNEHQADEVAEWLTQLNDCVEKNVFVIGTTNCLDRIDKTICRHGRIDHILYVGLPDEACRKQLFEIELSKRPHDAEIDIEELARITDGYTSSDISYMVKETARNAFVASLKDKSIVKISQTMLRDVVESTRPSVTPDDVRRYEKMRDDYLKLNKEERPKVGYVI